MDSNITVVVEVATESHVQQTVGQRLSGAEEQVLSHSRSIMLTNMIRRS